MNENVNVETEVISEEIVNTTKLGKFKEIFKKNGKKIAVAGVAVVTLAGLVIAGMLKGKGEDSDDDSISDEDDSSNDI